MKKIFCTFLLLFNILFLFGQNPHKQNLANLASITFPQKPATLDTVGHSVSQFIDSAAIYAVISREINQDKALVSSDKLSGFYDETIKGFLDAAQGKLISKKTFEIDGLKGIEIEFISTSNSDLPDLRFARFIFINNTVITVSFMTLSENKQATQTARTQFFNSLTITADKTTLTQGLDHPGAFLIGSILGKFFAWAVILGAIAGAVLLIKRMTTKKKIINKTEV